jgi:hypothetical protein
MALLKTQLNAIKRMSLTAATAAREFPALEIFPTSDSESDLSIKGSMQLNKRNRLFLGTPSIFESTVYE